MTDLAVLKTAVEQTFTAARLENVFAACFASRWNTRLVGGAEEPYYQPSTSEKHGHTLYYRQDYFASALHEVAHWCLAGEQRRQQFDFGYWYAPEGRTADQQRAFEAVERKPQALEWFFSRACNYRFQLSVDNLPESAQEIPDATAFQRNVIERVGAWQKLGLPARAEIFYTALCREFHTAIPANRLHFSLAQLK